MDRGEKGESWSATFNENCLRFKTYGDARLTIRKIFKFGRPRAHKIKNFAYILFSFLKEGGLISNWNYSGLLVLDKILFEFLSAAVDRFYFITFCFYFHRFDQLMVKK